jgi:DNA-binding response OmpR family regulator
MRRILIVDDNEATRTLCRQNLEDSYEIIETGDPEFAFPIALENKPDVILMQLLMPKLSGFELCKTFSTFRLTKQIPIFVVGADDMRNKISCLRLGASGYVEKPIDFEKLKNALTEVLLSKKPERREHVRVRLNVILKLKGNDREGKHFEIRSTTLDMGAGGFLCTCNAPLELGVPVEVFLCSGDEHYLGRACAVRVDRGDPLHPRLGFHFVETADGGQEKPLPRNAQ